MSDAAAQSNASAPAVGAGPARGGPIDFWFDFISPFGYCASLRIDAIAAAHGREVRWHPMLLGVNVLKVMGLKAIPQTPLKGDYAARELARYCRRHLLVLARDLNAPPMNPLPAGRAFAWLLAHAPGQAMAFAGAALEAHWRRGIEIDTPDALREAGAAAGIDAATLMRATSEPDAATLLRAEVDAALARGVFGSPFVIVDDEPFFGVDKLELIDEWLARGGW